MGMSSSSSACVWSTLDSKCVRLTDQNENNNNNNTTTIIQYEYECPLVPYHNHPPSLLPDWMASFHHAGLLEHVTLLDVCWPGTHDSLSYDLSLTVSAEGSGRLRALAALLRTLGRVHLLPGELEDFVRTQAKTQQLTLAQQLDNGIRFLDVRIMRQPDNGQWYSIHFMQTKETVETYWWQLRQWLEEHPDEMVILFVSREGNPSATGPDQYPDVTSEQKHAIWDNFTDIFDGLLIHTDEANVFSDSVASLIQRNYRVVPFVADYHDFTMSSPFALDAARIQNIWNEGSVFDEEQRTLQLKTYFQNAKANNDIVHKRHGFTLLGMNTASPEWQVVASAEKRFLGWKGDRTRRCSANFQTPEPTHWCPETLLDIAQLSSYYVQTLLEYAHSERESSNQIAFPNAIYLDALDWDGTIRTGSQLLNGHDRGGAPENKITSYAYVDTILSYNAYVACSRQSQHDEVCSSFTQEILRRKQLHPHRVWDDHRLARYSSWPSLGDKVEPSLA